MSRFYYLGCVFLMSLVLGLALFFIYQPGSVQLQLSDYHKYQCSTGSDKTETFKYLTAIPLLNQQIAESLCQSQAIASHFGHVEIIWKNRNQLTVNDLLNGNINLLWSRDHNLAGLLPNHQDYFNKLLDINNYSVYWYSRMQGAEYNKKFFAQVRIGLLANEVSQTHYLLPMDALKKHNIQTQTLDIVYFDDTYSLYQAFKDNHIDLIPSGASFDKQLDFSVEKLLISANVQAASIYLDNTQPESVACAVKHAIQPILTYLTEMDAKITFNYSQKQPCQIF
ncbi:hypothetical protein [Gayadomonas joobiniege]|uniref:hypothetical protein n=1 Tax=Gayadomonas joobiniege TaxID=1234606 RepID=UPI00037FEC4C|nr:hypothetical protein [Gayadomonas joobiniege]